MVVKVNVDDLSEAIRQQLETYNIQLNNELNKAYQGVADFGKSKLNIARPYHNRTGKYAKSWAVDVRKTTSAFQSEVYSIHSKKQYRLTHLLEFGHAGRNGSRKGAAGAFEHIAPVEKIVNKYATQEVERVVREMNK